MWSIKVRIPSFGAVKVRAGRYVKMLGWVALLSAVTGLTSWLVAAVLVALYYKLSKLTEREALLGRNHARSDVRGGRAGEKLRGLLGRPALHRAGALRPPVHLPHLLQHRGHDQMPILQIPYTRED